MKIIIIVSCNVCFLLFLGWHIHTDIVADRKREEKHQREIEKCDKRIDEYNRLFKLINSDDPKAWDEYMMEQLLHDDFHPV